MGIHKPIYHPMSKFNIVMLKCILVFIFQKYLVYKMIIFHTDYCGDHVIVINSKDIALRGDEWRKRVYFHHTTYIGGASWTLAWELHNKNPTLVINKHIF